MITYFQEPLEISRKGRCVSSFKLIYVSSGQRTLAAVEGVSHKRERDESGRPSSGDKFI
jgi:hypothetical protein